MWEAERAECRRDISWPDYYLRHGYHGPLHSYDSGNGAWEPAFDAPSAYMLVHKHHYPGKDAQTAFDALHQGVERRWRAALSSFWWRAGTCLTTESSA